MQEYARGFANALAGADTVTVYMPARRSVAEAPYRQRPILRGAIAADLGVLAREEVDAWYALNAGFVPLAPHLAAKFFATFHGNDFLNPWLGYENAWLTRTLKVPGAWRWAAWLLRTLRQRAIRQGLEATAHVFAVSRSTADLIARVFPRQMAPVSVVPPGVDDTFFQEGYAQSVLPQRLLTVARLTQEHRRKNVDGVLRALCLLPESLPVRYTVVGDGDSRPQLEGLARELGVSDRVEFVGRVSRDRLLAWYRRSHLFVLAARGSRLDVEGFGIVYLEASASGVPVLCSREGGSTDAVADGWNGILLPSSSPEDIAAGILRFAETREQFPPDRVRAFAEQFRWPRVAARIRQVILSHFS